LHSHIDILQKRECFNFAEALLTIIVIALDKRKYLKAYFKTMIKEDRNYDIDIFRSYWKNAEKRKEKIDWMICWDKGNLIDIRDKQDLLYFHFLESKNNKKFKVPEFNKTVECFFISEEGITFC
jgi:hypothetical protein